MSYPSLRRLVVKRNWRKAGWTTVRTEDTPPGDAAEAAFGRLGIITGPETGRCRGCGPCRTRIWTGSSPDWKPPGPSSTGCPSVWSPAISLPRRCGSVPCIRCSPWAFRSTPSTGASSPARRGPATDRKAQGGKGRASTPRSVSSGPRLQRSGPHEGRGPAVVPAVGLNMGLRHHPQEAAGGLPG